MRPIPLLLALCACVPPHSGAVLAQADRAFAQLQGYYLEDAQSAADGQPTPAAAWDATSRVLDEYGPAWWALRAVYEANDPLPPFCAAIPVWEERGVHVDDLGLCDWQRPCWTREESESR